MKKLNLVFIALIVFTTTACRTFALKDERANLVIAQKAFRTTIKALTRLRKAGKISDKDKAEIDKVVKITDDNIILWEQALYNGDVTPNLAKIIDKNLESLATILIKHKEQ